MLGHEKPRNARSGNETRARNAFDDGPSRVYGARLTCGCNEPRADSGIEVSSTLDCVAVVVAVERQECRLSGWTGLPLNVSIYHGAF